MAHENVEIIEPMCYNKDTVNRVKEVSYEISET